MVSYNPFGPGERLESFRKFAEENPEYRDLMTSPFFQEQLIVMSENMDIPLKSYLESYISGLHSRNPEASDEELSHIALGQAQEIYDSIDRGDDGVPYSYMDAYYRARERKDNGVEGDPGMLLTSYQEETGNNSSQTREPFGGMQDIAMNMPDYNRDDVTGILSNSMKDKEKRKKLEDRIWKLPRQLRNHVVNSIKNQSDLAESLEKHPQVLDAFSGMKIDKDNPLDSKKLNSAMRRIGVEYKLPTYEEQLNPETEPYVIRTMPRDSGSSGNQKTIYITSDDGPYIGGEGKQGTMEVINELLENNSTLTFGFSGYNMGKIPKLTKENINNYPNIAKKLPENVRRAILEKGGEINLFKVMKYTGMNVANHTLSHPKILDEKTGKYKYFRDLSPDGQRSEFGLNQFLLAETIQENGVDPGEILTNYSRVSNNLPPGSEAKRDLYKITNGLGLIPVEGLNHKEKPDEPFSDYITSKDLKDIYKGNMDNYVDNRFYAMEDLMKGEKGIPVFYLHLHNEAGRRILQKLIDRGYNIQCLPRNISGRR